MDKRLLCRGIRMHSGVALLVIGTCVPNMTPAAADELMSEAVPVDTSALDGMRGGFLQSNNVKFSLMYSSQTLVDGIMKAQSALAIKGLDFNGGVAAIQTGSLGTLVQNGSGNTVTDSIPLNSQYIDVIQNTLDQTVIQHTRNLELQIQGINGLQTISTSSSLTRQIVESLH